MVILSLLTDRYSDWEVGFLHGIGSGFYGLDFVIASPDGRPITSVGGLKVTPTSSAQADPGAFDALVVCGGPVWESEGPPDISSLQKAFVAAGKPVGAICGATLAAARAGLLDDRRHTSNAAAYLSGNAPSYRGAAHYQDTPRAVADRGVITAPASAPASFAAAVFRAVGRPAEDDIKMFEQMAAKEHSAAS